MQQSSFSINLSSSVVVANMQTLATFKVGEKASMDFTTGKLSKEERYFSGLRRAAFGGFDKECANETFKRAVEIINQANADHTSGAKKIKKGSTALVIYNLFLKTITGVQNLAETYKGEGKGEIADRLNEITKEYFSKFSVLPNLEQVRLSKNSPLRRHKVSKKIKSDDSGKNRRLKRLHPKHSPRHKKEESETMKLSLIENQQGSRRTDDKAGSELMSPSIPSEDDVRERETNDQEKQPSLVLERKEATEVRERVLQTETKGAPTDEEDDTKEVVQKEVDVMKKEKGIGVQPQHNVENEHKKGGSTSTAHRFFKTKYRRQVDEEDRVAKEKSRIKNILYKIFCCGCLKG